MRPAGQPQGDPARPSRHTRGPKTWDRVQGTEGAPLQPPAGANEGQAAKSCRRPEPLQEPPAEGPTLRKKRGLEPGDLTHYLKSLVIFSPVAAPVHFRLWNVEGVECRVWVGCEESGVLSGGMQCRVCSVE